jgi:hypothetical protein
MAGKSLLGKLDRSAFGLLQLPRLPGDLVQGFLALEDLTRAAARRLARSEEERLAKLADGMPLAELVTRKSQ